MVQVYPLFLLEHAMSCPVASGQNRLVWVVAAKIGHTSSVGASVEGSDFYNGCAVWLLTSPFQTPDAHGLQGAFQILSTCPLPGVYSRDKTITPCPARFKQGKKQR